MICKLKGYTEIDPRELDESVFQIVGKDWMEIVMGNPTDGANAMTASWGGMGIMWNLPVAFVVIRGEEYRYSRHIIDKEPLFTICVLPDELKEAKAYLGSAHGWDDAHKIATAGLHEGYCGVDLIHDASIGLGSHVHVPFIEESKIVLVCEKVAVQELPKEAFVDDALWEQWYTKEGQHCLYIANIRAAFVKDKSDANPYPCAGTERDDLDPGEADIPNPWSGFSDFGKEE